MKAMKEFGYNNEAFREIIGRLKFVNYFHKKILDAWESPKYASQRRMNAARYASHYFYVYV